MAPPRPRSSAPSLATLKSALAAKQAFEEEAKRAQEEALRLEAEVETRRIAEEQEAEAARIARKEREKQKREDLKKQGKLLSKSEKEKALKNKLKLQQLQQSGNVHIAGMTTAATTSTVDSKKKASFKKKKSEPKKEQTKEGKKSESSSSSEQSEIPDDWEAETSDHQEHVLEKPIQHLSLDHKHEGVKADHKNIEQVQSQNDSKTKHQELRSPICCILGHVDTGKTKLLDRIRHTNVQEGEAGGITQQIGATYFPIDTIKQRTEKVVTAFCQSQKDAIDDTDVYNVPGLLVIDTPGHESFTNLRSRGTSLCNIAILVVDIMHGLEPQTLESIGLLRHRKTPFIVALNKIDRLYGWNAMPDVPFEQVIQKQSQQVQAEFDQRLSKIILAFAEQGLNADVFYRNTDFKRYISLIPTSAISGDGIADLLFLLVHLTQKMMSSSLRYLADELQCTVLEVKVVEGLGTTIDVILSNGVLREGDKIAVCGLNGPIVTTIRALLTPQPLRELRIKSQYVHHKRVKAALGVKICAPDLEKAVAGSALLCIDKPENEESVRESVMADLTAMLQTVDKSGSGVCVQASTLGSLEALLAFLKASKIPVSGINIGPIHRKDITRASVMTETAKEYAVILAFDVRVERDAEELADELDVRIFRADIIYHLFDQFTKYMTDIQEQKKRDLAPSVVFPCVLKIVPGCVFNKRNPIIIGVEVVDGSLRPGTPLCVVSSDSTITTLGRVTSIEVNHRPMDVVRRGGPSVAIKIESASYEATRMYGRHFMESDPLYSRLTRSSIDVLKESFREEVSKEEWALVVKLKKLFNIS